LEHFCTAETISGDTKFCNYFQVLQVYLEKSYCITATPCPDNIWGNGVSSQKYSPLITPLVLTSLMTPGLCEISCFNRWQSVFILEQLALTELTAQTVQSNLL